MKSVVTIGGGTGQFTLLSGLKKYPVKLSAIVSMADDGGSTGKLRDELGVLPPGDVRQCLVALSESGVVMRDLFNYRFESSSAKASEDRQGGLVGYSFGNIFLSALEKITGSFDEAVSLAGKVLAINGEVIPVTTSDVRLVYGSGDTDVVGEDAVQDVTIEDPESLRLEPDAEANPKALEAISSADCIVMGPGNLYCSIIPNLLVGGVPEAIRSSRAKVVYNCNLMTKKEHTDGYSVSDFVREIERYTGSGRIDFVTFNNVMPEPELQECYAVEGQPVRVDMGRDGAQSFFALPADLISSRIYAQKKSDAIRRTLIRHDPEVLASLVIEKCLGGV